MRKLFGTVFLVFSCYSTAYAVDKAVMVGGEKDLDACTSTAAVSGLDPKGDGFLAVRSNSNAKAKLLDKLIEGQVLYVCDESADGKWLGVIYSKTGVDCGVGTPIYPKQAYNGACQSGWVSKKWINPLAG